MTILDTHKEVKALVAVGMPEEQAERVVDLMERRNKILATKDDIRNLYDNVQNDINSLRKDVQNDISNVKKDIQLSIQQSKSETIKWVVSLFLANMLTIIFGIYFR